MAVLNVKNRGTRRRRVLAHACPACRELWAVRGSRHPSGAWIFLCSYCDWRRLVVPTDRRRAQQLLVDQPERRRAG